MVQLLRVLRFLTVFAGWVWACAAEEEECNPVNMTKFENVCPDNCIIVFVDENESEVFGTSGCDCIVVSLHGMNN